MYRSPAPLVSAREEQAAEPTSAGWCAHLDLGYRATPLRTVLARRARSGPLAVQRSFYPEGGLCHNYLLHPPGGVVGGDRLDIRVECPPGTAALLTTPGATKFYRSARRRAVQRQQLAVTDASLEWLPQENILFPGAVTTLHSRIELAGRARFFGWEIHCLGRPANGERYDSGSADFVTEIYRDRRPLLLDRTRVRPDDRASGAASLRGRPVFAALYATGVAAEQLQGARELAAGMPVGMTLLEDLLVVRYLGESTEQARTVFVQLWQALRPVVIGRPPSPPRIWTT